MSPTLVHTLGEEDARWLQKPEELVVQFREGVHGDVT